MTVLSEKFILILFNLTKSGSGHLKTTGGGEFRAESSISSWGLGGGLGGYSFFMPSW